MAKTSLKVIVASKNPIKLASAQQAFETCFPDVTVELVAVEVSSGVSEQPMSGEETMQGALNRAVSAAHSDADYSVGIEGGMSFYTLNDREYGIEVCWVCVHDCKTGKHEIATGPGFPVFPNIIGLMHQGLNLTDAMQKEYGLTNLGQKNGYIGWLSNDAITRQSSNYEAVLLALSALVKEES